MKRVVFIIGVLVFCSGAQADKEALIIGMGTTGHSLGCRSCPSDAQAMSELLTAEGFNVNKLANAEATRSRVLAAFSDLANKTRSGELCVIYYSGHGSWTYDTNGDEVDGMDETWVLYDDQLIDDEIGMKWTEFQVGAQVFFISDSCCSQTVLKNAIQGVVVAADNTSVLPELPMVKALPPSDEDMAKLAKAVAANGYNTDFKVTAETPAIQCAILSFAACEDGKSAKMGDPYSVFTQALLKIWAGGKFKGNYQELFEAVRAEVTNRELDQVPQLMSLGTYDERFQKCRPFTTAPAGDRMAVVQGNQVEIKWTNDSKTSTGMIMQTGPKYIELLSADDKAMKIPRERINSIDVLGVSEKLKSGEISSEKFRF